MIKNVAGNYILLFTLSTYNFVSDLDYKPASHKIKPSVKMRPFHWNPFPVNSLKVG